MSEIGTGTRERTAGIHHVTAIASDAQRNLEFYTGVLGLRLVKRTVNFDDPGTYHFYFGDAAGSPGTILTFFPWQGVAKGRPGAGEVAAIAFAVPRGTLAAWGERLARRGVSPRPESARFEEAVLAFEDPDGLALELIETADGEGVVPWADGGVPAASAIRGFHSATLRLRSRERSESLLTRMLGFEAAGEASGRHRFRASGGEAGAIVDVLEVPDAPRADLGAGSVHHIAWRTPDDEGQARWMQRLSRGGLHVTPVQDRQYFRSIYFREPGGVLYEIATDPPGFTLDEVPERLGSELRLPPWLEPMRPRIERMLPSLDPVGPPRAR